MAGDGQRLASWLTGLSLMLKPGSDNADDVSRIQFLISIIKIHAIGAFGQPTELTSIPVHKSDAVLSFAVFDSKLRP
jgi:hypothetical protein